MHDHDDRWSFIVCYVGGAVLLSIYLNLFWVTMLMLANFALKLYRNHLVTAERPFLLALWQIKLDISLIVFAVAIAVYAEHIFAILGISRMARAGQALRGLHLAARFGVIERALRVLLLIVDDLARIVNALVKSMRRRKAVVNISEEMLQDIAPKSTRPWENPGRGDFFSIGFGAVCFGLILLNPLLTGTPAIEIMARVAAELSPELIRN